MSNDRVECVARALCKADGNDPNVLVPTGRMILTGEHGPEFCFAWTEYQKEARRFVAALNAATAREEATKDHGYQGAEFTGLA